MKKNLFLLLMLLIYLVAPFSQELQQSQEIGVTFLTPGGLNVSYGYAFSKYGFRIVGMHLGKTFGLQSELNYFVRNTDSFRHGPGLVFGYIDASDTTGNFTYTVNEVGAKGLILGGHYSWSFDLFYISLGLAYGLADTNIDPPIYPLFNLGINHRF